MSRYSGAFEGRGPTLLAQRVVQCCSLAHAVQLMLTAGMRAQMARSVISALGQGLQHGVV